MCNDTTVSKLKNDFHYTLSKFSHELRNPLTLINSGLQMIASAHPEVKEYEHWDDVMDNLDYVKELLDELSAFNNAGHVKRENIDTCSYLRTILSSIKPTLDYLEITLETDIPDSMPSQRNRKAGLDGKRRGTDNPDWQSAPSSQAAIGNV